MSMDPCRDLHDPNRDKAMEALSIEAELADEILAHPGLSDWIKARNPSPEAQREQAREWLGTMGGYRGVQETPNFVQLRKAKDKWVDLQKLFEKGSIGKFRRGLWITGAITRKVPIFNFFESWMNASSRQRYVSKTNNELIEDWGKILDRIGRVSGNIFSRPQQIWNKTKGRAAVEHQHMGLVRSQAALDVKLQTIEFRAQKLIDPEGIPDPAPVIGKAVGSVRDKDGLLIAHEVMVGGVKQNMSPNDVVVDKALEVRERRKLPGMMTEAHLTGEILPKDYGEPALRTAFRAKKPPQDPALRKLYDEYVEIFKESDLMATQITKIENSVGMGKEVRADVMMSRYIEAGNHIVDELNSRNPQDRIDAWKRIGITVGDVGPLKPGARVSYMESEGVLLVGKVLKRMTAEDGKTLYTIQLGKKAGGEIIDLVEPERLTGLHGNVPDEGVIYERITQAEQAKRDQIFDMMAREFGVETAGAMQKFAGRVQEHNEEMWRELQEAMEYHRQFAKEKLKAIGIPRDEIGRYLLNNIPGKARKEVKRGYLHRLRYGEAMRQWLLNQQLSAGGVAGEAQSALGRFEEMLDVWGQMRRNYQAEGKKQPPFDIWAARYFEKHGRQAFTGTQAAPAMPRKKAFATEEFFYSYRPAEGLMSRLHAYGAHMQSFVYSARMKYAYEKDLAQLTEMRKIGQKIDPKTWAKKKEYLQVLTDFADVLAQHREDILFSADNETKQHIRRWINVANAWEAFAKIGHNLKTVTQNSTQLLMYAFEMGYQDIAETKRYMDTVEGQRILKKISLDWDPNTVAAKLYREDQLFNDYLEGVRPKDWSEKMLKGTDTLINKTKALHMLGKNELVLHRLAFMGGYRNARMSLGENPEIRKLFEDLPTRLREIEARAKAGGDNFDRFRYLEKLGVSPVDLDGWNLERAKGKYQDFIEQRAIDVAHDFRIFVNGDYSTAGRPEWFRTNWGRLAFQFRLFDLIFLNYMGQHAKELGHRIKADTKLWQEARQKKWTKEQRLGEAERRGLEGPDVVQMFLGKEVPREYMFAGRFVSAMAMLKILSGFFNVGFDEWFEPQVLSLAKGMAQFVDPDEDEAKKAFYGRPILGQFVGPAASDVMDLVHWGLFNKLETDSRVAQLFFGSETWKDTPYEKKWKKVVEKFSVSAARVQFTAGPKLMQGHPSEAIKAMAFSPDYEAHKKFLEAKDLAEEGETLEAGKEILKLTIGG